MMKPNLATMASIPAGSFLMGSDRHYPEEAPVHRVSVGAFHIDRHAVTEAKWEYAPLSGLEGAEFAWGDEPYTEGRKMVNNWQGDFLAPRSCRSLAR